MINRHHPLPLTQQSRLLRLSRSSLYYEPHPTSERDLRLMGKIDKLHTARPFAGARMLRDMLSVCRQTKLDRWSADLRDSSAHQV